MQQKAFIVAAEVAEALNVEHVFNILHVPHSKLFYVYIKRYVTMYKWNESTIDRYIEMQQFNVTFFA